MAEQKTNEKVGSCTECEGLVQPGEGSLWWESGPDDGGDVVGRTPAGWRVTHLDPAKCVAHRAALEAKRNEARTAGAARANEARTAFGAERAALRAEVERYVAEHGLVEVPCRLEPCAGPPGSQVRHEICTPPAQLAGEQKATLLERSVYPAAGGHSTGWQGTVREYADGIVATYGPHEGPVTQWASPELVERGLSWYRVAQWWAPRGYSAQSYPGPGVPEAELSDDERTEVARLRLAARDEARAEERRRVASAVEHKLTSDRAWTGATWELEPLTDEVLDAYLDATAVRYSRAAMDAAIHVVVRVRRPATGRKRAGKATARPPYTTELQVHAALRATLHVEEVA